MSPDDRVRTAVEPAVTGAGLVLEGTTTTPAGRRRVVRVVVDLPDDEVGSVDSDRLTAVSRAVAAALDADDGALGSAPYVLEVTTPGVSRPLVARRHWSRARTRLVAVAVGGAEVTGRVVAVDADGVVLEVQGSPRAVAWPDLGTGHVQVEFSRPGAADAGPGADDDGGSDDDEHDDDHDAEHDDEDEED